MNYIILLNRFYDLLQETRVSNNAQLLYYTLLQVNNKCSWADWFKRTNVNLSGLMSISEKSLTNAKNELKQLGLIEFISSKKRGECTQYRILNTTEYSTKEVQKKYKGSTKEVQSADINKTKPKPKISQKSDAHACATRKGNSQNKFNNFPQREYSTEDYADIESKLLNNVSKQASTDASTKASTDNGTKASTDDSTKASADDGTKASTDDGTKASTDDGTKVNTDDGTKTSTGVGTNGKKKLISIDEMFTHLDIEQNSTDASTKASTDNGTKASTDNSTKKWSRGNSKFRDVFDMTE